MSLNLKPQVYTCQTKQDWDVIIKQVQSPIIVEFYATWCPPCKKIRSQLDQAIIQSNGWIAVIIDVNDEQIQDVVTEYNVEGIPYVLLFHQGKKLNSFVGYNESELTKFIKQCTDLCK